AARSGDLYVALSVRLTGTLFRLFLALNLLFSCQNAAGSTQVTVCDDSSSILETISEEGSHSYRTDPFFRYCPSDSGSTALSPSTTPITTRTSVVPARVRNEDPSETPLSQNEPTSSGSFPLFDRSLN
ncbi:hypothetical protein PENTCL1PPCAC_10092, partial [Pristionchus entomophagus]